MKTTRFALLLATIAAALIAADRPRSIRASTFDEVVPQVILGGEWQTIITVINGRPNPVTVPVDFYGQDGAPLQVPLVGLARASSYRLTVPANGSIAVETEQPRDPVVGWGRIEIPSGSSDGPITGQVILRNRVLGVRPDYEAVFPFYSRLARKPSSPTTTRTDSERSSS